MLEKKRAGYRAADYVQDNMTVGLGTGSTAFYAIERIAERIREEKLTLRCVATSFDTETKAKERGIPLVSIDEVDHIDLTIDGVDEVDANFNAIKGGGACLYREKVVALSSKRNIWILGESKLVDALGKFPLPVEVLPFGHGRLLKLWEQKGYAPVLRKENDAIVVTDNGNYIIDLSGVYPLSQEKIEALSLELDRTTGVAEHGLFVNIGDVLVIGSEEDVRCIEK